MQTLLACHLQEDLMDVPFLDHATQRCLTSFCVTVDGSFVINLLPSGLHNKGVRESKLGVSREGTTAYGNFV